MFLFGKTLHSKQLFQAEERTFKNENLKFACPAKTFS
jgi:hypothetical protein